MLRRECKRWLVAPFILFWAMNIYGLNTSVGWISSCEAPCRVPGAFHAPWHFCCRSVVSVRVLLLHNKPVRCYRNPLDACLPYCMQLWMSSPFTWLISPGVGLLALNSIIRTPRGTVVSSVNTEQTNRASNNSANLYWRIIL